MIIGLAPPQFTPKAHPAGTSPEDIQRVAELIFCCLRSDLASPGLDRRLIKLLLRLPAAHYRNDPLALAGAVIRNPELPTEFSQLKNSDVYKEYAGIVDKVRSHVLLAAVDLTHPGSDTAMAVRDTLRK
jgi:hypothetical protein